MSRPRTVNGKRHVIGLKVSDAKYDAVEAARGKTPRALWVEAAIDKALAAGGVAAEPPVPVKRAARKTPRKRGGYEAGDTKVSDLPPPPASVTVPGRGQKPLIGPPASKPVPPPPPARALPARRPGQAVFQDPGAEAVVTDAPPAPAATRTRCDHRIFRILGSRDPGAKGVGGCCPDCGHAVLPGGYWEPECDAGTCGHPGT